MISLPDKPIREQYEDAVTSYIRSLGYFTETRIILKDEGRDILELDIVASPPSNDIADRIIIDAKSGETGFHDIFKIFGWRTYLGINKGCIIRGKQFDEFDSRAFINFESELSIAVRIFQLENRSSILDILPIQIDIDPDLREAVFGTGWYAAHAERICIQDLNRMKRENPKLDLIQKIKKYELACKSAFFEKDPVERAKRIYDAYVESPDLTHQCLEYIAKVRGIDERKALYIIGDSVEYPWVQYVSILEHRARILIIKNAIEQTYFAGMQTLEQRMAIWGAPRSFQDALSFIKTKDYRCKIPYLFHLFIEVFGGFITEGSKDIETLSTLSGIPVSDVKDVLEYYTLFFSCDNWFYSVKESHYSLKLMPAIWKGCGCFLRKVIYGFENYSDYCPETGWLLVKYHIM